VRRGITSGTPNKLQLLFETVVDAVQTQVKQSVGPVPPFVVPLAVSLFTFILVANWIELIPSGHHPEVLPAPTADVNLTLALALMVTVLFTMTGIRHKGFFHYTAGFFKPLPLFFIKIIEEIAKPLSLDHVVPSLHPARAQRDLEVVRHVHRAYPGLHFCPAHHPLLHVRR